MLCLILIPLFSCQNNVLNEPAVEVYGGLGCGIIDDFYGDVTIYSEIDSTLYLVAQLTNKLTLLDSTTFTIEPRNEQTSNDLFNEKHSISYFTNQLKKKLGLIDSTTFTSDPKNEQISNDLFNEVVLLDFDTKEKKYDKITEEIRGYLFPCSDIVSNSHSLDTLKLVRGNINITVLPKNKPHERIYIFQIFDAQFSKGDKLKIIKNYTSKNLLFRKGNPG